VQLQVLLESALAREQYIPVAICAVACTVFSELQPRTTPNAPNTTGRIQPWMDMTISFRE
jgi:hypothetical protein